MISLKVSEFIDGISNGTCCSKCTDMLAERERRYLRPRKDSGLDLVDTTSCLTQVIRLSHVDLDVQRARISRVSQDDHINSTRRGDNST